MKLNIWVDMDPRCVKRILSAYTLPANTRRWTNITPTLVQRLVFAGLATRQFICIWKPDANITMYRGTYRPLWYETVYLPLYKMADTLFHIQAGDIVSRFFWRIRPPAEHHHVPLMSVGKYKICVLANYIKRCRMKNWCCVHWYPAIILRSDLNTVYHRPTVREIQ